MSDINFQEELAQYLSKLRGLVSVGTPWWGFDVKSKPFGVQLYQGQILSRSMYPIHYEYIQKYRTIVTDEEWYSYADAHNGMCPYFSYADGNGTYRMPRIIDVHPRFSNYGDDVGKYVPAGIPNIYGTIATTRHTNAGTVHEGTGAFRGNYPNGASNSTFWASGATAPYVKYTLDASICSSVYGASDTVQPPAINMIVGEYVVSALGEFSLTTSEMLHERIDNLDGKVSIIENKTSYVIDAYKSNNQWYRIYSDGWIEQGGITEIINSGAIVSLHKAFSDTLYTVIVTNGADVQDSLNPTYHSTFGRTTTSFKVSSNINGFFLSWYACGY